MLSVMTERRHGLLSGIQPLAAAAEGHSKRPVATMSARTAVTVARFIGSPPRTADDMPAAHNQD